MKKFIVIVAILLAASGLQDGAAQTEAAATPGPQAASTNPATTGEITGKVDFDGTPPKLTSIVMEKDPVCVARHPNPVPTEDGEVNSNGTLPNVFIYVKAGAENYKSAVPSKPVTLDQRGCMYKPHVLGLIVGQELQIVSSDPTTHNIHPMPQDNREWNQSQAPGAAPLVRKFARSEIMIPVKCNQHPWMKAYIGVTRNPFFDVTSNNGTYHIKGLPPGDYTLGAWTSTFGMQERKITVTSGETSTLDFSFTSH